ncbi:hypothetical protein AG4045_010823 [Apium graveolens]|uniref:Uncharacterized protein n=2 Tax=Apium graveolens TaxID=4045 RepID=A0A6L5B9K6_APIGR|nr:hypothetical protein AG4045_010823 [Apium graveolens]
MARGRRSYGRPENQRRYHPRKIAPTYVWRPRVPTWEREFTAKIGNIKWEKFVEARKWNWLYPKILEWKDSACEEAFTAAKTRFWDQYHGYESQVPLPDPDMYIDNIDWTSEPDENNGDEDPMLSISEDDDDDVPEPEPAVMDLPLPGHEEIKPTGWNFEDPPETDLLTGFLVGEDDDSVLRDSSNVAGGRALRDYRQHKYLF